MAHEIHEINIEFAHCRCRASFEEDFVHIYDLYVHPKARGAGEAKLVLSQVISAIRATGYTGEIQIVAKPKEPGVDKERLKTFYERMGLKVYSCYM